MKNVKRYLGIFTLLFVLSNIQAQTTRIIVRAKAKDAKFLPATLGVHVTIRNNLSGEIMAKGMAVGGSGDTKRIMADQIQRGEVLSDATTSKFETTLELEEPTFVDIEVSASTNRKNGTKRVTTQTWLIPGKHIEGDGIVVEIPGFIVDILSPTTQQYTKLSTLKNGKLPIHVSVTMACGCVISPGGTWDSNAYTIGAIVKRNGKVLTEVPLSYTGVWNNFEGMLPILEVGDYEIHVYAYDAKTGNTGLDKINFTIL